MADMMDTLKGLLGDNADDKLSGIMKKLNSDAPQDNSDNTPQKNDSKNNESPALSPEMLMMAQSIMSRMSKSGDDDRTRLLMSLKPYMNSNRQSTIDSAVKMLKLSELSDLFKGVI